MRKPNPTATTTSSSTSVVNITTTEPQPSHTAPTPEEHLAPAPPHDIVLPAPAVAAGPNDLAPAHVLENPPPTTLAPTHDLGSGGDVLDHDMMTDTDVGVGMYESEEGGTGDYEDNGGSDEVEMDTEEDNTVPLTATAALAAAIAPPPAAVFEFGVGPAHHQGIFTVAPAPYATSSYQYTEGWVLSNPAFGWTHDGPGPAQPTLPTLPTLPGQNGASPPPTAAASTMPLAPPVGFGGLDGLVYPVSGPQEAVVEAQGTEPVTEAETPAPASGITDENSTADTLQTTIGSIAQQPPNPTTNPPHHAVPPPPPPPPPMPLQGLPPNPGFIPGSLTPTNADLVDFLRIWVLSARNLQRRPFKERIEFPQHAQVETMAGSKLKSVRHDQLMGDQCDLQGIDWDKLGVSRRVARRRRLDTYSNYTNNKKTDAWDSGELDLANLDSYFQFEKMLIRRNVVLAHFQLRSVLACPTKNYAFYAGTQGVHRINTATPNGASDIAIDFSDMPSMQVTTLDANYGVLVAGTFNGEYFLKRLDSDSDRYANGQITNVGSPITNHLHLYQPRTSGPAVAFSSNDNVFRTMDTTTEKFLLTMPHRVPMNCSAISPDRRLRVMVGDQTEVLIVNSETGQILQSLNGHKDFGFACDWSQDGWTVATGFQDKTVKIWDARRWCDSNGRSSPMTSIRSEMAGVRGLRFSPVGSGPRVLVAAEEADYINIIEARNFETKQTFDLFGEIGGVAFANEGNDLNVLVADKTRGGIVKFEQCGVGYDFDADGIHQRWIPRGDRGPVVNHAWSSYPTWGDGLRASKRRRAAIRDRMEPF